MKKINILITGGAGYIGSTVARELESKYNIYIIDNLVSGNLKLIKKKYFFYKFNCGDKNNLEKLLREKKIKIVIHLAASLSVEESQKKKNYYFKNNFINTKNLIDICNKASSVQKIIFSSTCAVYGSSKIKIVTEKSKRRPVSYYGLTKKICEDYIIRKCLKKYIILRYFNVVGSEYKISSGLVDKKSKQLFANLNRSILNKKYNVKIFGKNHDTFDGTCIRDYIHVQDIARIHNLCINYLEKNESDVFNCGYNKGYSVSEIVYYYEKIFNIKFKKFFLKPRSGDPSQIICDNSKIMKKLKWKPKYNNLNRMIISSYKWYEKFFKS